jgi:hypothetical protein
VVRRGRPSGLTPGALQPRIAFASLTCPPFLLRKFRSRGYGCLEGTLVAEAPLAFDVVASEAFEAVEEVAAQIGVKSSDFEHVVGK